MRKVADISMLTSNHVESSVISSAKRISGIKFERNRFKKCTVDVEMEKMSRSMVFKLTLILSSLLTLAEPVLVSYPPENANLKVQVGILGLSSMLFVVNLFMSLVYYGIHIRQSGLKLLWHFIVADGFECFCLTWGWIFIFSYPGIAALRCFRVLRLSSLFELYYREPPTDYKPEHHFYSLIGASHATLRYVQKLSVELFYPHRSRGGLIVLCIVFYVSYIFGVVFWRDWGQLSVSSALSNQACETPRGCFIIMLRLAFYDGTGFDYLAAVQNANSPYATGYAALLVLYFVFTSIVLLNGLIGIFGHAFTDEDTDETAEDDPANALRSQISALLHQSLSKGETKQESVSREGEIVVKTVSHKNPFQTARRAMCETRTFKAFLAVTMLLTVAEPLLVGIRGSFSSYLQLIVLSLSSAMVPVNILLLMLNYPGSERWHVLLTSCADNEMYFEVFCIGWGWTFFSLGSEGVAALRCMRVFRLFWYFELYRATEKNANENYILHSLRCLLAVSHKCTLYLRRLGRETFTAASRGGTIILAIFFYTAYLFGVVFWIEKGELLTPEGRSCSSARSCFYTFLRLAFYDGTGLDFLTAVVFQSDGLRSEDASQGGPTSGGSRSQNSGGYTMLLFMYIIVASMILLNGLIGVFGSNFTTADDANVDALKDREIAQLKTILDDVRRLHEELEKRTGQKDHRK